MTGSKFKNAQESPGHLLWQVTTMWQKEIRRVLEPMNLTQPQFVLLHAVSWLNERDHEEKGVTQVQIAQFANVDVNVTSQVLRTLEKRGLITRSRHHTDTRANIIHTTEAGAQLALEGIQVVEAADQEFFGRVGERREEFMKTLQQFINHSSFTESSE